MGLRVYSTLLKKKTPFETLNEGEVRMYVCGPTVYDLAHVGHAMSSIVFDVIRRYLEYRGYRVHHVMNYTDIDDKVIDRAKELGEDPLALAERHVHEYNQHLVDLNILPASAYPRVSSEIEVIERMVAGLIENDHAYVVDGDVFFRIASDDDYGKLSGRKVEDMRAGARLEVDERKEDPADFALWKSAQAGEPSWPSPWGEGRPGWHIECSAMSLAYLGEEIDIHGGGSDLVFPHHENEIAQSENFTGKPFARYWLHNGMLQFTGEKMSKSLGNVVTIEAFLRDHPADVLRLIVLNSSYRSPLTFNEEVVSQAERSLERLRSALRLDLSADSGEGALVAELKGAVVAARGGFEEAMDDDFNTPGALSHIFDLVRAINTARDQGVAIEDVQSAQGELTRLASVLGLRLDRDGGGEGEAGPLIEILIEVREKLRESKQFALSDLIRDRLDEAGIKLEDHAGGTSWRAKT
jgi:cysteinyl-tRNA synthetase